MDTNSPQESNGGGPSTPFTTGHVPNTQSKKADVTELLIVVFVHGFKGTDETFGAFPQRLQHILTETIAQVSVDCIVFPAYETKGDLGEAVVRFADWLTTLTVEREVASGGGAGKAKIILCGHSMGGLLIADTLLQFINTRPDKRCPLWPKIIACIAFDTPYLGLHPYVFKNTVTNAVTTAQTVGSTILGAFAGLSAKKATTSMSSAQQITSDNSSAAAGWKTWTTPAAYAVGSAVLAGAAVGGAYYKRDDINVGLAWATDHMKYVGNLWDEEALKRRVDALMDAEEQEGVYFRTFYTYLPPSPPVHMSLRTFVVLPQKNQRAYPRFIPARNSIAPDELQAHTGMFAGKTNDGYYDLGLATSKVIRESLLQERSLSNDGRIPENGRQHK